MQGLLAGLMLQKEKLERFKVSGNIKDAISTRLDVKTGRPDTDCTNQLQIDAIALYLLIVAEMTSAGDLIFNILRLLQARS